MREAYHVFRSAGVIQVEQCVFPFLQKEQFVGVMVVKSAYVIVLGVFCVFYLDHFFRGIEVVVHGGSFVAHGSGTCMRMDGTVLIRQNPSEFAMASFGQYLQNIINKIPIISNITKEKYKKIN